jgi:hypothetical protein
LVRRDPDPEPLPFRNAQAAVVAAWDLQVGGGEAQEEGREGGRETDEVRGLNGSDGAAGALGVPGRRRGRRSLRAAVLELGAACHVPAAPGVPACRGPRGRGQFHPIRASLSCQIRYFVAFLVVLSSDTWIAFLVMSSEWRCWILPPW